MLDENIRIDGTMYRPTIFAIQAQAAYAKSLIFLAEARVAVRSHQYIWAAIASYYSLFHLSVSLMFMVPQLIEPKLLARLVKERAQGAHDPTSSIAHRYLPPFLTNCELTGLTPRLRELVETAKNLREEYANYGPRVVWKDDKPTFLTCGYSFSDVRQITKSIPPLLKEVPFWARKQCESADIVAGVAAISLDWFLNKKDLLYRNWCSPDVLTEAKKLRAKLPLALPVKRRKAGPRAK